MLKIIEKTKIWFAFSSTIIIIGIIALIYHGGLNLGIDFKGGSDIVFNMPKDYNMSDATTIINKYINKESYETTKASTDTGSELEIKAKSGALKEADSTPLEKDLQAKFGKDVKLSSMDSIGASVGKELTNKAFLSLSIALVCMLIFIGIRFELKFGAAAVIALVHDVLITLSVYAVFNISITTSFIAAMLTIIGYSMNDTIVIFDRIRENLRSLRKTPLNEVVDVSITHTIRRSIYTVTTTLITTSAVYILVPIKDIRDFTLPLIIGIASGCYSSIFIASPFWVIFKKFSQKRTSRA